MLFNSVAFLIFFPTVVILYFFLPMRWRWLWLLTASLFFYMYWKVSYGFLLLFTAGIDYLMGLALGRTDSPGVRKALLCISLLSNLGILFFFKYYNFFVRAAQDALAQLHLTYLIPYSDFLLPVGISFYTFQSLSYTIDVYRRIIPVEKHFGRFLLFVTFFPQLVAGPIERAKNLLPQMYQKFPFDYQRIRTGLLQMAFGFFKKLVIADRLAIYVNAVYNHPEQFTGLPLWMATFFFAFQIYCDFSGYSDIAIGAARVMGFSLMGNFRRPYYAKSIHEFWQRWHISLSTWFRDYLYIPLGGNRVSKKRWYFNLFVVFLISGFWHGANWTFIIWGGLHGFYLLFSIWTKRLREKWIVWSHLDHYPFLLKVLRVGITFHLVLLSWVFFRANSLHDAFTVLKNMLVWTFDYQRVALGKVELAVAFFSLLILETVHLLQRNRQALTTFMKKPAWMRWLVYYGVIMLILLFGEMATEQQFIYFQF